MLRVYKNYESLEGKVSRILKKSLGLHKGYALATSLITLDIWTSATCNLRLPNDHDIAQGIYEFLGTR